MMVAVLGPNVLLLRSSVWSGVAVGERRAVAITVPPDSPMLQRCKIKCSSEKLFDSNAAKLAAPWSPGAHTKQREQCSIGALSRRFNKNRDLKS
jgi:hypothetical protein